MLNLILLRNVNFSTRPYDSLKHISPSWRLTPWVQQQGTLHQVGRGLTSILWLLLVNFTVGPDFLISILGFIISTWRCAAVLASTAIYASSEARWLSYSATWDMSVTLASVMFFTVARYSDVAQYSLANDSSITTRFLASYPPWCAVCWYSRVYDWDYMKWA